VNLKHVRRCSDAPPASSSLPSPRRRAHHVLFQGANVLLAAQDVPADIWQGAAMLHLSALPFG
jgi:hypothetical protein